MSFRKPSNDFIDMYILEESSSDWVPEWKKGASQQIRHDSLTGSSYYMPVDAAAGIVTDASMWHKKELRCYWVSGPPGTGKTEFANWLAGKYHLPLFSLSLENPRLTDGLLSQLLTQNAMHKKDNFLVVIDEFHTTLRRWQKSLQTGASPQSVSMEGFCMVLQGSKRPPRGIILLCGLDPLESIRDDPSFAPLFRRVHASLVLQRLSNEQGQLFVVNFLRGYVSPSIEDVEISTAWVSFAKALDTAVSIDMLKTYLMWCMSSFADPNSFATSDHTFMIDADRWPDFRSRLCAPTSWTDHTGKYK